jgi:hypothetical protein
MKKLLAMSISVFLASTAFAKPQHPDLSQLSKDVLVEGLRASAVCMIIEGYGIKRLLSFYDDHKNEPNLADKTAVAASMLYEDFIREEGLSFTIIQTLQGKYKLNDKDIGNLTKDEIAAADSTMKDKYDAVHDYEQFITAYAKSLDTCETAVKSFVGQVKNELEHLDKEKINP